MNMFLIIIGLSVAILAVGVLGMAFNIIFLKKKFPNTSVGHNPNMRKLGISCEKCDELKRCKPKLKEKKNKKDERMKALDEVLKL